MSRTEASTTSPASGLRLRARINFAIFSLVAAGGGWAFVALDRANGDLSGEGTASASDIAGSTSGQGLWILAPLVCAVLLRWLSRDGGGGLGLSLPRTSAIAWFAFSALLFPAFALAVTLVAAGTGLASLNSPAQDWLAAAAATAGFLFIKNIFEELIFRGYGTRTAVAMGLPGLWPHLLVGAVWALWHLPLYLAWMPASAFQDITSLPPIVFFPLFLAGIACLSVLYGELRLLTGSIWPGVLLHTVANIVGAALLTGGVLDYGPAGEALLGLMPNTLASMVIFGGVGLWLASLRLRPGQAGAPS